MHELRQDTGVTSYGTNKPLCHMWTAAAVHLRKAENSAETRSATLSGKGADTPTFSSSPAREGFRQLTSSTQSRSACAEATVSLGRWMESSVWSVDFRSLSSRSNHGFRLSLPRNPSVRAHRSASSHPLTSSGRMSKPTFCPSKRVLVKFCRGFLRQ